MTSLECYIKSFANLNRAPGYVWTSATKKKAPHKPFLLLSLIDLLAEGCIGRNFIELTPDFTDLFSRYWQCIVPAGQRSSIALPFFHLQREGFWHLMPVPGMETALAARDSIQSVAQLEGLVLGAKLDEELFDLLKVAGSRDMLRACLLKSHFSEGAQEILSVQVQVNSEAFRYSMELHDKAHGRVAEEPVVFKPAARDQGFRRAIVQAYDHRCALCGIRMISLDGHTVVEAAHIKPWAKTQCDDIQNGMALCRLCHWAFDKGMMGVSGRYRVITSPLMAQNSNAPGFLMTLSGREILGPVDERLWPDRGHLSWHRRENRLRQ